MIAVDASAPVALLLGELEAAAFADALEKHGEAVASPTPVFESAAALVRVRACSVSDAQVIVDDLLREAGITVAPVTAFDRFGKGRRKAQLNIGDCVSYALAKTLRLPLLFKGDDFSRTDLEPAA